MKTTIKLLWSSPKRTHIYARWTILVMLNAAYSFFLAMLITGSVSAFIGIMLAIASFVVIYAELEAWLLFKRYTKLAKQLKLSASIKITTIFLPFIDLYSGLLAVHATQWLTGVYLENMGSDSESVPSNYLNISELTANYLTTMIDGVLLSILVALILIIIKGISRLIRHDKQQALG